MRRPALPPPEAPPPIAQGAPAEPKFSMSFLGVKVDGSGASGVRFAFWIALTLCGLVGLNLLDH